MFYCFLQSQSQRDISIISKATILNSLIHCLCWIICCFHNISSRRYMEGIWTGFPYNKLSVEFYSGTSLFPRKINVPDTFELALLEFFPDLFLFGIVTFATVCESHLKIYGLPLLICIMLIFTSLSYHMPMPIPLLYCALFCLYFAFCSSIPQWLLQMYGHSNGMSTLEGSHPIIILGVLILGSSCRDLPRCILDLLLVSMECHSST